VVVSTAASWRTEGIYRAAERTNLDLVIPIQPNWTTEEVDRFRGAEVKERNSRLGPGQARCWLGHLNAVREILTRGWSTALVMEDDSDWDVMIKQQMSLVAPMIRVLLQSDTGPSKSPYGDDWDLLWLGHCGEEIGKAWEHDGRSRLDPSLPESPMYRTRKGDSIYHPPQLRIVQRSLRPRCTYAYAITAAAAGKIYQAAHGGKDDIITGELAWWCNQGGMKCITVFPELFHHHKSAGQISSEIAVLEGWEDLAQPARIGYTPNIKHSARCNSQSETLVSCREEVT
jgi:hypothetical protein